MELLEAVRESDIHYDGIGIDFGHGVKVYLYDGNNRTTIKSDTGSLQRDLCVVFLKLRGEWDE